MITNNFNGGAILIDGASQDQMLAWLYQNYPSHQPLPLLLGTPYEGLMELAPILVDAPRNSPLYYGWSNAVGPLKNAVWLQTCVPTDQLFSIVQRRLRVRSPDGRQFWLRLADARPLLLAWRAQVTWPEGFWHGISGIWLLDNERPVLAWQNHAPEIDSVSVACAFEDPALFGWPLLEALTLEPENTEGEFV